MLEVGKEENRDGDSAWGGTREGNTEEEERRRDK